MEATLYFDGGIRNGICAYGWLLVNTNDENKIIASGNNTCGFGTSNIAEYCALIAGLQGSIESKIKIIHIIGDSQLIIKQVTGVFKVKKIELKKYKNRAVELLNKFDDYTIKWVPRKDNRRADALVNEIFDNIK